MNIIIKFTKKLLEFILYSVLLIALAIILFLFITSSVRKYEQYKMIRCFKENSTLFEAFMSGDRNIEHKIKGNIYYTVTPEFEELGVESIDQEFEGNISFEQKHWVLGMIPHGIIYVGNIDTIPRWVKIEPISGYWYYYRIVS